MQFVPRTWNSTPNVIASEDIYAPSHTERIYDPREFHALVLNCSKFLKRLNHTTPFDAVAACGNSGIPLASAMSFLLGVPILTVRKSMDARADRRWVNGPLAMTKRYIIVDDLISSGGTVRNMVKLIDAAYREQDEQRRQPLPPELVAIVLYDKSHAEPNYWAKLRGPDNDGKPLFPVLHLPSGSVRVRRPQYDCRSL